jgi:ABC-2 type transport system ATP-binding protein
MTEALRATDVSKTYGETTALDGVSLTVESGEVFGLIGPNGAGKTTLVRALTGTTTVEGEVRIFEQHPARVDNSRIGLLPQSFGPPERLTARELLQYYAGLYTDAREPEQVLADVGLTGAADTWYENLSGGQQRRVCVGTALVNDPEALLLDEPTTGIDPAGRRSLWRLLSSLAEAGTTILLTSHDMAEVQHLADRVGLLADGRMLATGTASDLIEAHGGEPRLLVRTDADPGTLADARPPASPHPDGLAFDGIDPTDIGRIVKRLDERGIEYDSLTWTEPTLEDVYLRLAGEDVDESFGTGAIDRPTQSGRNVAADTATEGQS